MKYSKDIEIVDKYDFVVCGGGMTGVAAAISAARKGLKTVIVENQGCLGGVATSGGVNHLLGAMKYDPQKKEIVKNVGGIFEEISQKLIEREGAIDPETISRINNPHGWVRGLADGVPFDSEHMKLLLDELCIESGVKIYFFTDIIDVVLDGDKINSIIVHNKSGLFAIEGTYFADTTGDADIAHLSGCKTKLGREEDNLMGPASLEMHVDNVYKRALAASVKLHGKRFRKMIQRMRNRGEWNFPYDIFISVQLNNPDTFMINTIRQVGIDGTDGDSITKGMIEGRRENFELFQVMKDNIAGFKKARIRSTANMIGIRETRRIEGLYTLTVNDLVHGINFSDSIACSGYGWDLPDPKAPSLQPYHGIKRKSNFTQIPYRCLVPKKMNNLIVAGRSISVERDVLGPVRVMGPCIAMGEAAGLATYVALQNKEDYANIDVDALQNEIQNNGGILRR